MGSSVQDFAQSPCGDLAGKKACSKPVVAGMHIVKFMPYNKFNLAGLNCHHRQIPKRDCVQLQINAHRDL